MRKCLMCFCLLLYLSGQGQQNYFRFIRLNVSNGLSHNQVNAIHQDDKGFTWFATLSGLNRFDGYDFKIFKHNPNDTSSLRDNYISNIFPLPNKHLWIVTRNGNCIYNSYTESFSRNDQQFLTSLGLPSGIISSVVEDADGGYWFVYQNLGGIYRYHPALGVQKPVSNPADEKLLSSYDIAAVLPDKKNTWVIHRNGLIEKLDNGSLKVVLRSDKMRVFNHGRTGNFTAQIDRDGEIWIYDRLATAPGGIFLYNPHVDKLDYLSGDKGKYRLNSNVIAGIVEADDGNIWIGTDHGGINIIDKRNNSVQYLLNQVEDNASIPQNSIYSVYKDNRGVVWFGTYKQGLCYHNSQTNFKLFKHRFSDPNSLPFEDVNKFAEDARGNLWIGTNGGGLIYYNRSNETYKIYKHNPLDINSISNDVIVSLLVDHQQKLWVGTYLGGLNYFDGKKFVRYKHDPATPSGIADNNIWDIFEDSDHTVWFGTLNGGVNRYDRQADTFSLYHVEDRKSLNSNYVSSIIEDRMGNIWFGTSNGIDVMNKKTGVFTYIGHDDADAFSLSNNNVNALLEDSRGLIWVGTRDGLNMMVGDRKFNIFKEKDGLPDNAILSILEDLNHNLWLATPNGLCNVIIDTTDNQTTLRFVNYDESDGLQGRVFNEKAAFKTRTGELLFGGFYGFNMFSPEKFNFKTEKPAVVLTGLQVFNQPVKPLEKLDGHTILKEALSEAGEITLKYSQNVFSLSFSVLGIAPSGKEKFHYKLEGFNREWLTTDGTQRNITYTNINPGKYTLHIKLDAGDPLNTDAAPALLRINVLPPFWLSIPAFVGYLFLAIGLLWFARYLTIRRAKMRFQVVQEKKEAQRIHELDMLKLKFFTNISHEFRTPISLILAPVEKMLKTVTDETQKKQYQLMYRNGKRLLGLVNQLLDFRKLEMKELRLYPSVGDIVVFLKEISATFSDLAEKKNIDFHFSTATESLHTSFDKDKMERIMFNLLSNAFKFTREEGRVSVTVAVLENSEIPTVSIRVCDSGIGIPEDNREKIFERFFQHENAGGMLNNGSGIGLAISREFAKLHGGSILVDSKVGEGTCFTVLLPIRDVQSEMSVGQLSETTFSTALRDEMTMDDKRKSVLIVEDNDDIRFYIKDNLRSKYNVYQAINGKEGLEKARKLIPDLIISDVMMPEMDGLTFCRAVKNEAQTSHIPVILLTARSSDDQKLEGFKTGAVDYITKPFSFEMLQSRIESLLLQQETLQKRFQQQVEIKPGEISTNPLDEAFITKAVNLIEQHMSEAEFSVEDLSRAMYMSRVALYKKLISLTGQAPLEFIRVVRIKKAMQLIQKTPKTISEIAYEVGFNDPKYFSKLFKKEVGVSPSEYAADVRKQA